MLGFDSCEGHRFVSPESAFLTLRIFVVVHVSDVAMSLFLHLARGASLRHRDFSCAAEFRNCH
jgi:hypothetical protein